MRVGDREGGGLCCEIKVAAAGGLMQGEDHAGGGSPLRVGDCAGEGGCLEIEQMRQK